MKTELVRIVPDTRIGFYKLVFDVLDREGSLLFTAVTETVHAQHVIMKRLGLIEKQFNKLLSV